MQSLKTVDFYVIGTLIELIDSLEAATATCLAGTSEMDRAGTDEMDRASTGSSDQHSIARGRTQVIAP